MVPLMAMTATRIRPPARAAFSSCSQQPAIAPGPELIYYLRYGYYLVDKTHSYPSASMTMPSKAGSTPGGHLAFSSS